MQASNPHIAAVASLYANSFCTVASLPAPTCDTARKLLKDTLGSLVHAHTAVIPLLARGFMESGR